MPQFLKGATYEALQMIGLTPGSQEFVDVWLAHWRDDQLPHRAALPPEIFGDQAPFIIIHDFHVDGTAMVTYVGDALKLVSGVDMTGKNAFDYGPEEARPERLRRIRAVAEGAVVRVMHQIPMLTGPDHFFERISLPLAREPGGVTPILCHLDGGEPGMLEQVASASHFCLLPELIDIVPLADTFAPPPTNQTLRPILETERRAKIISRSALRLLLNLMNDAMAVSSTTGLDPTDYLLAVTVGCANVSHIDNDPALTRQFAGLVEPDSMRRGISRAAIARATNLPQETVRRRINRLLELGVLVEREDGIILSAGNRLKIDARTDRKHVHAQFVERFIRDLRARGVSFGS